MAAGPILPMLSKFTETTKALSNGNPDHTCSDPGLWLLDLGATITALARDAREV